MAEYSIGALPALYSRRHGDAPAITYGDHSLSWTELEQGANRWARVIAKYGVAQDDFVALTLPNSIAFHQASFAIWKLGATPCVFSRKLPEREVMQILQLAHPKLIVGSVLIDTPSMPQVDLERAEEGDATPLPDTAPAYWKAMTSGGSTGRPKIIVDHHPSRFDPTKHPLVELLHMVQGGVMLNPGPLYHNAAFLFTSLSLFSGSRVIGMERFDAEECLYLIERHKVQWVCFVPTMMHRIWALPKTTRDRFDVSSLQAVWHMASACPVWLKQAWCDWIGAEKIWELYGGTEAGSTVVRGDEWQKKPGTVGRVEEGTTRVFNECGQPAGPNEVGEIFLPAAAREKFHYIGTELKATADGSFSLGDLGFIDSDGYLFLADRRTDLIIRGGANIYPAEVEAVLDQHPGIASSVVIGLPCDEFGQRVHAIVQAVPDTHLNVQEVCKFLSKHLAPYKLPESFEVAVGSLRDDAGKVRRYALKTEREDWMRAGKPFRLEVRERTTSGSTAPPSEAAPNE